MNKEQLVEKIKKDFGVDDCHIFLTIKFDDIAQWILDNKEEICGETKKVK